MLHCPSPIDQLLFLAAFQKSWNDSCTGSYRRVAHTGSKVRTNPPSFAKFQFSFYLFVLRARLVLSSHDVSAAQANGTSTVNVCTKAVRWASARPRLRCDQRRPSSLALPAGLRRVYKKSRLSMVSAIFILLALSAQCVTPARSCKARSNERRNPTRTDKPSSFLSVLVEGEAAINPSQTLLVLVHLSRFESLRPRKSRQAVRSKKNNALESVSAPSSIRRFNIGRIGGRRFLCTMRSVSQKSWSRCWAVDHKAYDQLELIYVSSCVEGRKCMMLKR